MDKVNEIDNESKLLGELNIDENDSKGLKF